GKQGDIVALPDQFLGEVRHDPLGTAVELRRTTFRERRDLGYLHGTTSSYERSIDKGPARPSGPRGASVFLSDTTRLRLPSCNVWIGAPGGPLLVGIAAALADTAT